MIKQFILSILLIAMLLTGCSGGKQEPENAALTKIRLPMGYIPSVQYAPFYVAVDQGFFADEGLEIEFDYKYETDGVSLVGANELPFALVSAEQVPLARAQGLPVVYVLEWWQDYPVAVVARPGSGIQTPADLKGKKIGLPGLFGASYVGLRALLDAVNIPESEVRLDSIGFNQVEALVSGQEDAVVVYDNNEPIQLKARGYDTVQFAVKDFVTLASNGVITNEKTIAENPALVRRFNRAVLRGLEETLADPAAAFNISKKYVEGLQESDWSIQWQILNKSIEYWKAENLGEANPQGWENMQKVLLAMGMLKEPIDLTKAYSNDFLP